jgi:PKD repeat protein
MITPTSIGGSAVLQTEFDIPQISGDWRIETVDCDGIVGWGPSIAIDSNDNPHIGYRDRTNEKLKYAKWTGSSWTFENVATVTGPGADNNLALDSNDNPHFSFRRYPSLSYEYASWDGTKWRIDVLESKYHIGEYGSIAIDQNDIPHISYGDTASCHLRYAKWNGSAWNIKVVDRRSCVGRFSSIAIDSNGYPHISYVGWNFHLGYAKWNGTMWRTKTLDWGSTVGFTSIAIDANDNPHISYYDIKRENLKYAKWNGSAWNKETVDSIGSVGEWTSLALDSNGHPHISYLDRTNGNLKYAVWNGTVWELEAIDSLGQVGWFSSLALDSTDTPHISYLDVSKSDLKYATKGVPSGEPQLIADAGPDQTVNMGDVVQFDGSGTKGGVTEFWINQTVVGRDHWGGRILPPSIAVDSNDNPHLSFGNKSGYLLYARWTGTNWSIETVEPGVSFWGFKTPSLALDDNDFAHIAYYDREEDDLKYARWTGTNWSIETVESDGDVGAGVRLTLDTNGYPHMVYSKMTGGHGSVKYAKWDGSRWVNEVVDSTSGICGPPSIDIDSNGNPHMSYGQQHNNELRYARWTGSNWNLEAVASAFEMGCSSSIALDSKDQPHIGYHELMDWADLENRYARRIGANWSTELVDAGYNYRYKQYPLSSMTMDSNDHPHLSYMVKTTEDLRYARWDGTSWVIETADSEGEVGYHSSIDLDSNGVPHIAYFDGTNKAIKYAKRQEGNISYVWDFGDGSPHGTGARPTHIYASPGTYEVNLTVTDTEGATDSDICIITVIQTENQPPIADANGPYYADEGSPTTLDGSGSHDPDNDTLQYRWDLDNDGTWDTAWSSSPTVDNTWMDDGTYTIVLQVKDAHNETDSDNATVSVRDLTPTAEFTWSPEPQNEGSSVQFTDKSTSYPDAIASWSCWEFGDGGTSTDQNPNHIYADNGVFSVTLTVEDEDGSTDSDSHNVTILNVAPVANAGEDKEGYEVSTFTFDGSCTDPGALDTHTYEWDFDYDGMTFDVDATGQSVTHTWIDDFDGDVALRVTDDDGGEGIDTAHVLVKNVPPTVELEVLPIEVDVFLRIAGEKWHDVSIELYEDGVLVAEGSLTRYPGSPNDQMLDLTHIDVDISRQYSAIVRYTPEDDPVNGQPNGANPCWIILKFNDGEEVWLHHTFNVQHPETYIWEVDLTAGILSHGLTFVATAFDPGADDLTFRWDFGDGTTITSFYPNPIQTYPVEITETVAHAFPGSGTYTVTLTVEDDDAGEVSKSLTIVIP